MKFNVDDKVKINDRSMRDHDKSGQIISVETTYENRVIYTVLVTTNKTKRPANFFAEQLERKSDV